MLCIYSLSGEYACITLTMKFTQNFIVLYQPVSIIDILDKRIIIKESDLKWYLIAGTVRGVPLYLDISRNPFKVNSINKIELLRV